MQIFALLFAHRSHIFRGVGLTMAALCTGGDVEKPSITGSELVRNSARPVDHIARVLRHGWMAARRGLRDQNVLGWNFWRRHGAAYVNGKLYIAALRLRGILRVDANTFAPEFLIPYSVNRAHGIAYDERENSIWMVSGNPEDTSQTAASMGLTQYDTETGRVLATAVFADKDCDPHGLAWHDGELYSCDAGIHPGWPDDLSPTHGQIFKINFV